MLHERPADTLALAFWKNGYGAKAIPAGRTVFNEHGRKRYVADNFSALLCDEGNRQRTGLP